MPETVEGEAQEMADSDAAAESAGNVGHELMQRGPTGTLFGTDDPVTVIEKATVVAKALADVIEQRGLFKQIGPKKHVLVEGWTLLGSMLGVFPITEWTRPTVDSGGKAAWEARVVAQTRSGEIVGTREAMCSKSENRWAKADDYAIRSMAQTRAVSGALSGPLRFVMVLAGYEGTPEAEAHTGGQPEARTEQAFEWERPSNFAEIVRRYGEVAGPVEMWTHFWFPQAIQAIFGEDKQGTSDLRVEERSILGQKLSSALYELEGADVSFYERPVIQAAFSKVTDGIELTGPPWRLGPKETDLPSQDEWASTSTQSDPSQEEVERLAEETIAGPKKKRTATKKGAEDAEGNDGGSAARDDNGGTDGAA
jgi:hypothetical protein